MADELDKLSGLEPVSPEFNVTRTYLEWLTNLPWGVYSPEIFDIHHAQQVWPAGGEAAAEGQQPAAELHGGPWWTLVQVVQGDLQLQLVITINLAVLSRQPWCCDSSMLLVNALTFFKCPGLFVYGSDIILMPRADEYVLTALKRPG